MRNRVSWLFPFLPDEGALWLTWLVRLRWVAIFAQLTTLGFVFNMLGGPAHVTIWLVMVFVLTVANLVAMRRLRKEEQARLEDADEPVSAEVVLAHLTLDVLALTTYFALGGGPDNPFTPLFLAHIAMAAVMLPPRHAGALTGLVLVSYLALFGYHEPLHYERHSLARSVLIPFGQLLAFAITAISVSVFVMGTSRSLRRRKEQLLEARDRTARTDRLRSVGTLAAGAAHELNTPLSTLGLRLRRIGRRHQDEDTVSDLEVMRTQLDRCTSIVQRLLIGAGDPTAADIERRPLAAMCKEAVSMWSKGTTLDVTFLDEAPDLVVELPGIAFQQALINLLENSRQAQESVDCFDPLQLRIARAGTDGIIELTDNGCGLPDASEQVGEPFFTTKPTGTGLGVFVAANVADGAGGGLRYLSPPNGGTTAVWWFPEIKRPS